MTSTLRCPSAMLLSTLLCVAYAAQSVPDVIVSGAMWTSENGNWSHDCDGLYRKQAGNTTPAFQEEIPENWEEERPGLQDDVLLPLDQADRPWFKNPTNGYYICFNKNFDDRKCLVCEGRPLPEIFGRFTPCHCRFGRRSNIRNEWFLCSPYGAALYMCPDYDPKSYQPPTIGWVQIRNADVDDLPPYIPPETHKDCNSFKFWNLADIYLPSDSPDLRAEEKHSAQIDPDIPAQIDQDIVNQNTKVPRSFTLTFLPKEQSDRR